MASIRSPAVVLSCLTFLTAAFLADGYGGRLGGRTEIENVRTNKEVQDLGRFSVEEYNRGRSGSGSGSGSGGGGYGELKFMEVVKAQRQVVSGIKYYLKISVTDRNGVGKMFDSEVVVQAWLKSKKLLSFSPSTN